MKRLINLAVFTFIILASNLVFGELIFDISNKHGGSKDIEMDLTIHQKDFTFEEVDIQCGTEKFENYRGTAEYSLIDEDLISLDFEFPSDGLKIREKEGNCMQFLEVWRLHYSGNYQNISFTGNKISKAGKDTYEVSGILDLQGDKKNIMIIVEAVPIKRNSKLKLKFQLSVDLLDYRTEEEDIFELWEPYWYKMDAIFRFDLTAQN